jgi:hypothetical protein
MNLTVKITEEFNVQNNGGTLEDYWGNPPAEGILEESSRWRRIGGILALGGYWGDPRIRGNPRSGGVLEESLPWGEIGGILAFEGIPAGMLEESLPWGIFWESSRWRKIEEYWRDRGILALEGYGGISEESSHWRNEESSRWRKIEEYWMRNARIGGILEDIR